jgi:hypothetical protein
MTETSAPVENPTWYANIRGMFNSIDISHMKTFDIDLTSYDQVKQIGGHIYGQVAAGNMPPGAP